MVPGGQAGSSELDGEGSGQQGQEAFFPLLGLVALSYSGRGDFAPCIVRYPYCWGSGSAKTGPVVGEGTRDRGSTTPPPPPPQRTLLRDGLLGQSGSAAQRCRGWGWSTMIWGCRGACRGEARQQDAVVGSCCCGGRERLRLRCAVLVCAVLFCPVGSPRCPDAGLRSAHGDRHQAARAGAQASRWRCESPSCLARGVLRAGDAIAAASVPLADHSSAGGPVA